MNEQEQSINRDRQRFRAWNKMEKVLHYDAEQTYDFMYGSPVICKFSFGELLEDDNYVVEQCLGVKDKNGKLIYEGDIIEAISICFGTNSKFEIYSDGLQWRMRDLSNSKSCIFSPGTYCCKVVGNIHEGILEK